MGELLMAQRRKMTRYMENKVIEMLYSGNTLTNTCDTLGIARMTEYKHRKKKKSYRDRVDAALETRTEAVEDALYTTALTGTFAAQRFFLIIRPNRWIKRISEAAFPQMTSRSADGRSMPSSPAEVEATSFVSSSLA